jgi:hypothetical protein
MRVHMMMIERQTENGHTNAATVRDDHPPFKPGDMSEKDTAPSAGHFMVSDNPEDRTNGSQEANRKFRS